MASANCWLQVSLDVDGEMAEAAAEVLARYAPRGVVIESIAIRDTPDGPGAPVGPVRVYAFLPVDEHLEDTRHRLEQALWYLGCIRPLPRPAFQLIEEQDWTRVWKRHYRPVEIGSRLLLLPPWLEPPPGERIPVFIDPGMAFGTGTHPTTRLCLEIVGERAPVGGVVIDIGCGSGVLAIAALKLGAARALGVDTDPEAVAAARKNAELNGLGDRLLLGVGSVPAILAGKFPLRRAPLVLANILAPVLVQLLEAGLADLLIPEGVLILSGILVDQEEQVLEAVWAQGLRLLARHQQGDWLALVTAL